MEKMDLSLPDITTMPATQQVVPGNNSIQKTSMFPPVLNILPSELPVQPPSLIHGKQMEVLRSSLECSCSLSVLIDKLVSTDLLKWGIVTRPNGRLVYEFLSKKPSVFKKPKLMLPRKYTPPVPLVDERHNQTLAFGQNDFNNTATSANYFHNASMQNPKTKKIIL